MELAHQVKVPVTTANNLGWVHKIHTVEGETKRR